MKEKPRVGNVSKNLKNPIMVAAISGAGAAQQREQGQRAPLLPSSEKDHNGSLPNAKAARPKGKQKQVSSRYMSPSSTSTSTSSSRRFPSPVLASRSTNSTLSAKRSQSADRPRPASKQPQPNPNANAAQPSQSAAAKLLVTSTRSLSVSFQGEAFPLPISKTKAATPATPERRRPTPVRGGGGHQVAENSRPVEQHRWPARTRPLNSQLSMSVDCTKKLVGNGFGNAHSTTLIDDGRRLSLDLGKAELLKSPDGNSPNEPCCLPCDLTASDSESVSSGSSTSGPQAQENCAASKGPRGIAVSARFWQETNSRLRRLQDPASPLSASPAASRTSLKATQLKRHNSEGSVLSSRTMASPIRGNARPASPSKLWASTVASSSPSRGMSSPARVRSAVASSINSSSSNSPSILCFSADARRGKIGEDRIFNAHTLRLLHNRYVQWRFVNARADATCMVQKLNAERHLWNAWVTISELRHSIILKRIKLLLLRQKLKLTSILKRQMPYLEEWALLDRDHYSSLLGATEALWASTLRLPVVEKAIANVPNVKDAVGSAVDVMQAMSSAIHTLSSKVEETNSLVMELINLTAKERLLLEQCREFLSSLAAMQVKDCSLRTQILQFCHALPAS